MLYNNISTCSHPNFTGKVDRSVRQYVNDMTYFSKIAYIYSCKRLGQKVNKAEIKSNKQQWKNALNKLIEKADLMHKDTVIKITKNPNNKSSNLMYLVAENKNLLQDWEHSGAANRYSIYPNNLYNVAIENIGNPSNYVNRFEELIDKINPKKLDEQMVNTSVTNLRDLPESKIIGSKYVERHAKSTLQVARDIGYNCTFWSNLKKHITEIRNESELNKENNKHLPSFMKIAKDLFC